MKYKVHGLAATRMFFSRCPAIVLRDRGVGWILSRAIQPILAFFPPLTTPDESARILDSAYGTMLQLAKVYGHTDADARNSFLAELLRNGVFAGHQHASKYPKVTEILIRHSGTIVEELRLAASPHLKVGGNIGSTLWRHVLTCFILEHLRHLFRCFN